MEYATEKHANIYATEEHAKICILEYLLENNQDNESIISNFIDCIIDDKQTHANNYLTLIEKIFSNNKSKLKNIITTCYSIAYQSPLSITIKTNK